MEPLPTLKEQFEKQYLEPVTIVLTPKALTKPELFELAKAIYERSHGHKLPFGFDTVKRGL